VDRFRIENRSPEGWAIAEIAVDLGPSAGRLVVDAVAGGAGLNIAQPFRPEAGEAMLAAGQGVADGAERIVLAFETFPPGAVFRFSLDLDDRLTGRGGTRVEGPEMRGARLEVRFVHASGGEETHAGLFDGQAATRAGAPCLS
jgi:hypothetical protein